MKIGIISLGGRSSKALAEACKIYFNEVDQLDIRLFEVHLINDEKAITYKGEKLGEYDCLCIRGSYKYALVQQAIAKTFRKQAYMPIAPTAFTIGHDKFLTLLELQKEKISVPKTYYAPNINVAKGLLTKVEFPIIIKVQEGTHGKGVMIAESKKSAIAIIDALESLDRPYIIQEFVETEETSDIRVIVCGKKVLASYKRVANKEDFRSNIHSGGTREAHILTKEQQKLAVKSAKTIGAEICGVDILNSDPPSVIEINLSPSMEGIAGVSGINVVNEVARKLSRKTRKFQEKTEERIKDKIKKKAGKKNGKKETHKKHKGNRGEEEEE